MKKQPLTGILAEIEVAERDLAAAQKKSTAAAEARGRLPYGASRARMTTANARWIDACERRDKVKERLEALYEKLPKDPKWQLFDVPAQECLATRRYPRVVRMTREAVAAMCTAGITPDEANAALDSGQLWVMFMCFSVVGLALNGGHGAENYVPVEARS